MSNWQRIKLIVHGLVLAFSVYLIFVFFERAGRYPAFSAASVLTGIFLSGAFSWRSMRSILRPDNEAPRKSWVLGILRPVLLITLIGFWIFRPSPPMGEGPAGPAVEASAFASPWMESPVLLVSIGDSISTGYGAPKGEGFPDLMIKNVNAVFPEMAGIDLVTVMPQLTHLPLAQNSSNSIEHKKVITDLPVHPKETFGIITMTCGGIDLIHYYGKAVPKEGAIYGASLAEAKPWIRNFESRLGEMMQLLKARFPGGLAVLLATIYDPTDNVGDIENAGPLFWLPAWPDGLEILRQFNEVIARIANQHDFVHVADIRGAMLGHGIHCADSNHENYNSEDPGYWYFANLEDPNVRGHDAIRRAFLNAAAKALRP
ncbi:MAG: hypothetical protein ACI97A_002740 [Planctomycetota bacterium]